MPQETIEGGHFSPDIQVFIVLLHKHGVRYVIVGGEAVIFYGYARLTGDVDFFFEPAADNARALFAALDEFWAGSIPGISTWQELLEDRVVFQFGRPPNRIDLLNRIDGVTFSEAWATRQRVEMICESEARPVPLFYVGLSSLIKNKAASGRAKDMDDLEHLRRVPPGLDFHSHGID